jgi:hypothetical protein
MKPVSGNECDNRIWMLYRAPTAVFTTGPSGVLFVSLVATSSCYSRASVGTFDGSAFVVCPKCGEAWEAEFVACWKCGYQSAAVASDDPVVAAHESAAGDGDREDGPLAFLTGLLSPGDAAMQAEIAAIHASGRAQIIGWMMLAGLPWLVMLTLGTAFRGLFLLPVVLLLHLIMLVGVASPHFFAIGLAVTASLGAIQALYAAVATFFAILVLIAESRD